MKKRLKVLFVLILSLNMLGFPMNFQASSNQALSTTEVKAATKNLGSAKKLNGNTIIISIFTTDKKTTWNTKKGTDKAYISDALKNLRIATKWISTNTQKYKIKSTFIYDWSKNKDLKYKAVFKENLVEPYAAYYNKQVNFIKKNVKIDQLKRKYKADNILFIFFFNTANRKNNVRSWAYSTTYNPSSYYEIINLYNYCDVGSYTYFTPASSYAHELLHCFGAPDLYYPNSFIPQKYVNYLSKTKSKDIMFAVNSGDVIRGKFTDVDAYYTGLKKTVKDITKWKLGKSEHF